jgi:hypothetical protein
MSFVVHTIGTGRRAISFAVGLRWVVLDSSGQSFKLSKILGGGKASSIRSQGHVIGASRYALNPIDAGVCGFFNDPSVLRKSEKSASIYSLSALFTKILSSSGMSDGASILMMQPSTIPDKRILIIVEEGLISVDALYDRATAVEEVNARLKHYPDTHLFSQLDEFGHPATPITWDDFAESIGGKDRVGLLSPLPTPAWFPLLLGTGIVAGAGLLGYQKFIVEPDAHRKMMLESQKQDKTPAYVLAVDKELTDAGWDRSDFLSYVETLRAHPVLVKGWKLSQADCDLQQCKFNWDRLGGSVDELASALAEHKVIYRDSNLEKTITTRPSKTRSTGWSRSKLLDYQSSLAEIRPSLQRLTNAGVSTSVTEPQKWAGVELTGVSPDAVLAKYSVELGGQLHLINGVVNALPESVLIKSMSLVVGDNDVRFSLKGVVYVK